MELAKELGYVSVDKMLSEMTSKEYTEWMAYNFVQSGAYEEWIHENKNAGHVMKEKFARFAVKKDK